MTTFTQPPFWAQGSSRAIAPHAIAILVTPAVAIVASSIAAATVITTLEPHHYVSGDTVAIAGHLGSTPALDGDRVVTVLGALSFSVPVTVTVAGAGGTVTRTIAAEPLTLVEGKLRAGLDWADGDPRDALMRGFIAAARAKVQLDTGVALLTQTYDVFLDAMARGSIALPWRPVQSVTSVKSTDTAGAVNTLDPLNYTLDPSSVAPVPARLALSQTGVWPSDLRTFQPWAIRIVVGHASVAALQASAPLLVHAMGLLVAHYATVGRDLTTVGTIIATTPYGYDDAIADYVPVVVA